MEVVCLYCGVAHVSPQSFCNGCGGALPAAALPPAQEKEPTSRRALIAAACGLAVLAIAVFVIGNRLSGPQQVEIVNLPEPDPGLVAMDTSISVSGADQHRYLTAARFAAAYTTVHPLRMMLTDYRMSEGTYPATFADMRINQAELTDGQHIKAVALRPGGILIAHLEPSTFGDDALLKLKPTDVMAGTRTRWDCTTTIPNEDRLSGPGNIPCDFDASLRR